MITLRRHSGGGYGRGAPLGRSRRGWARWALFAIGVSSLLPMGCASFRDPCGGGPFSNCRLFNGGLFRRNTVVATPLVGDACGEPFLSVPVEGDPLLGAPGVIVPAPSPIDLQPAPIEGGALEPIPAPAAEAFPTSGVSPPAGNQKTLYETRKPPGGTTTSRRGGQEASGGVLTSSPLSASGSLSDPATPLLDLPPLSAAAGPEVEITPPVPGSAEPGELAGETSNKDLPRQPAATAELPARPAESGPISLAPGIARFKVVEAQLAGGSQPNAAGWAFLAEKGYRTALDLRERSKVSPGDDAAALHAGLRYIALPVTPETINDELLKRFAQEISMTEGRPLYFFDDDGARSSILWFLKLVVIDGLEPETAVRDVEELGPKEAVYWLAANVYLEERAGRAGSRANAAPAAESSQPAPAAPAPEQPPELPLGPEALSPVSGPLAGNSPHLDDTTWRPMAAMLLTGLSLPLAYIGRGAFSGRTFRRLASLPAPARRLLSLPSKSDA